MQVKVTIGHQELMEALAEYVSHQIGHSINASNVKLYVKSKRNYRLNTWEEADVVITNDAQSELSSSQDTKPIASDTELKAEIVRR